MLTRILRALSVKRQRFTRGWQPPNQVLKSGLFLTFLNLVTGAAAYSYQLALGNLLPPIDFTLLNVTFSLAAIGCAPLGAIGVVAVKHLTSVATTVGLPGVRFLFRQWVLFSACGTAASSICFIPLSQELLSLLGLPDTPTFWLLIGIMACNMFSVVVYSVLSSLQLFSAVGSLPLLSITLKACFGLVAIVSLGFGFRGVLFADIAGNAIALILGNRLLRLTWQHAPPVRGTATQFPATLIPAVAAGMLGLASMQQVDIVFVNNFFGPAIASEYVAAAVFGKAILYIPAGIVSVVLPLAAVRQATADRGLFVARDALSGTLVICSGLAAVYFVGGPWFVDTVYAGKYALAGDLLGFYGIAMVPVALNAILLRFFIARGQTFYSWAAAAGALLQMIVLRYWHPTPHAVIGIVFVSNMMLAALGCGPLIVEICRNRTAPTDSGVATDSS